LLALARHAFRKIKPECVKLDTQAHVQTVGITYCVSFVTHSDPHNSARAFLHSYAHARIDLLGIVVWYDERLPSRRADVCKIFDPYIRIRPRSQQAERFQRFDRFSQFRRDTKRLPINPRVCMRMHSNGHWRKRENGRQTSDTKGHPSTFVATRFTVFSSVCAFVFVGMRFAHVTAFARNTGNGETSGSPEETNKRNRVIETRLPYEIAFIRPVE
jgi:hypothetical protein